MSLSYRAALGALWTITSSIGARAMGIVATLVLTRFVTPTEFGEVSIASVILISANTFTALGVTQYVISYPKSGRDVAFHATALYLGVGVVAFGATWLLADRLALLFDAPHVAAYIPWIALGTFAERVAGMPTRILVREMRFKVLGIGQLCGELGYVLSSLSFAMGGWGGFSLVFGGLARDLAICLLVLSQVPWREWLSPCRLQLGRIKSLLAYGLPFSASASLDVVARKWDNLLFAQLFSPAAAGRYSLAYNLADVPAAHIGEHIGDVLLPSFSRMDDRRDRRRALSRAAGLLALVVFPLAVGLGAVAHTLIGVLFDEKWQSIAPLLVVLSALSVVRPLGWLLASYLLADGKTGRIFLLQTVKATAIVVFIVLLAPFGEVAACAAVGLAFGCHAFAGMFVVRRTHQIRLSSLLVPMLGPLLACLPLVVAVLAVRLVFTQLLGEGLPWLRLVFEVAAGAFAYVSGAWLMANGQSKDLLGLLGGALRRRALAS